MANGPTEARNCLLLRFLIIYFFLFLSVSHKATPMATAAPANTPTKIATDILLSFF